MYHTIFSYIESSTNLKKYLFGLMQDFYIGYINVDKTNFFLY